LPGQKSEPGIYKAAGMDFQRPRRGRRLSEDNGIIFAKAEIAVENARIQLDSATPEGASAGLAPLRQEVETADPGYFQANTFNATAEANLAWSSQAANPCWNALFS